MSAAERKTADYRATADGWVAGRRVKEGDVIPLTAAQAKYETGIEPASKPRSKKG